MQELLSPEGMQSLLDKLGWSQVYFAERIGVSSKTVSRWVLGKSRGSGYPVAMAYLRFVLRVLG